MKPSLALAALGLVSLLAAPVGAQEPLPLPDLPPIGAPPPVEQAPRDEGLPLPAPLEEKRQKQQDLKDLPSELKTSDTKVPEAYLLDLAPEEIPNYRQDMRDIVSVLTRYAKQRDPRFLTIAGDGYGLFLRGRREVALEQIKNPLPEDQVLPPEMQIGAPVRAFITDFDAVLVSGLYCGNAPNISTDLLNAVEEEGLMVLTAEHCGAASAMKEAETQALQDGRLAHADTDTSARFNAPPTSRPVEESAMNVFTLRNAKSLLINTQPSGEYGAKGQWLHALAQTNHDVLVIDYFFAPGAPLTAQDVYTLKFKKLGTQRLVLAELNIGHAMDNRFYWDRTWDVGSPDWIAAQHPEIRGGYRIAFWRQPWKEIIGKSFAGIMDLGFDGVVLTGLDAYRWWEARTPLVQD